MQNYMDIQTQRYGDKIEAEYLVDDALLNCRIIKLILQPLVENAIFHGLEVKSGKGQILISAYDDETRLYINIVDNGAGIEPGVVQALNHALEGNEKESEIDSTRTGIGLRNVNSRIKLYYGDKYGVHVSSQPGSDTIVRLNLPLVRQEVRRV